MKLKPILLQLLILKSFHLAAQSDTTQNRVIGNIKQIETSYWVGLNFGGIWAHNQPVYHLAQSHPVQIYAEFHRNNPNKEWSSNFKSANSGICISYFDYRSKVLGKSLASIAFLEPRITRNLSFRLGTGLVFNSNPFNLESNTTNLMLGSSFEIVMHGQISFTIFSRPLGIEKRKPLIRLGLGLTHFSNGAFKQPNSGINNFYLSAGYCFSELHKTSNSEKKTEKKKPKSLSFALSSSLSLVEKYPVWGKKYAVFQLQGRSNYRLGKLSSLRSGLDLMYNEAVKAEIKENPERGNSALVLGLPIGHELHISNHLSLVTEFAFYIVKNHQIHASSYQRYGLRYLWSNGIFTGLFLKTHTAKAECLEFNFGFQL